MTNPGASVRDTIQWDDIFNTVRTTMLRHEARGDRATAAEITTAIYAWVCDRGAEGGPQ